MAGETRLMTGEVAQRPETHAPDWQSVFTEHAKPEAHPEQTPPPQSTSVSLPFLTPSAQPEAQVPLEHTPPLQSVLAPHFFPSAQRARHEPPQSTSVSSPSRALSKQLWSALHAP